MKLMIQRLAHEMQGAPGTVFVVGAGTGAQLPLWRELASPHLVLAEAHPRQAEELAGRIQPARNEEVWAQAIVANPATHATLQILNNPLYSSLQTPNELIRHYPNLRVTDQVKVAARSLGESIESLTLDATGAHLLVIDAPGQAWDLLSTTPVRLLQQFACIVVHCGLIPLYADDRGRSDITGLLEKAGFDVELDDPDAIHPRATVLLKRNDIRVKVSQLEAQLHKREDEYAAQVKLGVERDARLQQLTRDHDELTALANQHKTALDEASRHAEEQRKLANDRLAELQKLTREHDQQTQQAAKRQAELAKAAADQQKLTAGLQEEIQKLTAERDAQIKLVMQHTAELEKLSSAQIEQQNSAADLQGLIQTLTAERDLQTKLAAQHMGDLDKTAREFAEQQNTIAALQGQIEKLIGERDTQAKLAEQREAELGKALAALTEQRTQAEATQQKLESQVEKIKIELETSQKSNTALRQELASAKQTVSLSVKLQTMREADLTDLQGRYRNLLEQYENQRDLLVKLNDKLSAAAGYFHLLSSGDPPHDGTRSDSTNRIPSHNDSP